MASAAAELRQAVRLDLEERALAIRAGENRSPPFVLPWGSQFVASRLGLTSHGSPLGVSNVIFVPSLRPGRASPAGVRFRLWEDSGRLL